MSTTDTLTLTSFLEQRLAEDEAAAREAPTRDKYDGDHGERTFYTTPGPIRDDWGCYSYNVPIARVLAEVAAKRAIMAWHTEYVDDSGYRTGICATCCEDPGGGDAGYVQYPCETLRAIAAVYADHSDYRSGWLP